MLTLKTDVIVAAILHDIVEDTEVTVGMIFDNFNARIMQLVDRLTRDRPDVTKWSVEQILDNASVLQDSEALLIKVIDRLHNIQTLRYKHKIKQVITQDETKRLFTIVVLYLENKKLATELKKALNLKEELPFTEHCYKLFS